MIKINSPQPKVNRNEILCSFCLPVFPSLTDCVADAVWSGLACRVNLTDLGLISATKCGIRKWEDG